MTKEGYPESLNCWLKGYPQYIRVTFGPSFESLDGPWGNGSTALLGRIGYDAIDTNPVEGVKLADVKVKYSDTGTDVGWVLKISMYGWGTFFATITEDNYYIGLEKWFEIESTYFTKLLFKLKEVVYTQIPKSTEIPLVEIPVERIYTPDPEPGVNPPDPSEPSPPPPESSNIDQLALSLVNYYWSIWNINSLASLSISKVGTNVLDVTGWRLLGGETYYGGSTVQFYMNAGLIKMVFYSISINCEAFTFEEGWTNCSYSSYAVQAFYLTSLKINNVERLQDLIRRA